MTIGTQNLGHKSRGPDRTGKSQCGKRMKNAYACSHLREKFSEFGRDILARGNSGPRSDDTPKLPRVNRVEIPRYHR